MNQTRLVYVLVIAIIAVAGELATGVWPSGWPNEAYVGLLCLIALGVPLLFFWRRTGADMAAEPGFLGEENRFASNRRYLWGAPVLLLGPVLYVTFCFTMDVGRLPGPVELALNVFQEILSGSHFGHWQHYQIDDAGYLSYSTGPQAHARSAALYDAAQAGIDRLDGVPPAHAALQAAGTGSWVVFAETDPQSAQRVLHARLSGAFKGSATSAPLPATLEIQAVQNGKPGAERFSVAISFGTPTECPADWHVTAHVDRQAPSQFSAAGSASVGSCTLTLAGPSPFVSALPDSHVLLLVLQPAVRQEHRARFVVNGYPAEQL